MDSSDKPDAVSVESGKSETAARAGMGGVGAHAGNLPVATVDTGEDTGSNPNAYRDTSTNLERRGLWIERVIIDNFYGGDRERFDAAAGVKRG